LHKVYVGNPAGSIEESPTACGRKEFSAHARIFSQEIVALDHKPAMQFLVNHLGNARRR
jgi:hypothetical protein